MSKLKLFSLIVILALFASALSFFPGQVQKAQAASSVIYNIYATDGYMRTADFPVSGDLYIYGFIGGRSGPDNLMYYNYQTATVVDTGAPAPAPTGGERTPAEDTLAGHAQLPAPAIYATVGDVVEIRLKNLGVQAQAAAPNDPHSIHLHGLDVDAANDGVPETSVGAVPANLCVDGTSDAAAPYDCAGAGGLAPGAGNVVVYMFTAETIGTSMWHCHQEADIHVQMGMYGALVIYNADDAAGNVASSQCTGGFYNYDLSKACGKGPGSGVGGSYYGQRYDKDVIMLLSELDSDYHWAEEGTFDAKQLAGATNQNFKAWNPIDYVPEYWLINGLSFPNTIHVDNAAINYTNWIQAFPNYDPLIVGDHNTTTTYSNGQWRTPGEKVLIRMINMGFETQPMHVHGYHLKVLGNDQRPWTWANRALWSKPVPFNQGLEKNTILIGSGETYELLVDIGQQALNSTYPGGDYLDPVIGGSGTQTRMYDGSPACDASLLALGITAPALNMPVSNQADGCPSIPDAGNPANPTYIGGPVVSGAVGIPMSSQIFPFHNHDDYKATNDGAYPGGMFTMVIPLP
ncbi:MAG: multicopper oxidase domain-containing protein [Chloroflexi bacterium]|nr:multicopper oxidase domain-containing protein [Chloroflexota bacterium]